jgi:hypothetical protein
MPKIKPSQLTYLSKPDNKKKINALYRLCTAYSNILYRYLRNPNTVWADELNKFYLRELVPEIRLLVRQLKIDRSGAVNDIVLPTNYLPFPTLYESEQILKDDGKNSDDARTSASKICGIVKRLLDITKAYDQDPIEKVQEIVKKAEKIIKRKESKRKVTEIDLLNTKRPKTFTRLDLNEDEKCLYSDTDQILIDRGVFEVIKLLFSTKRDIRSGRITENGTFQKISVLQDVGHYKTENSVRNALFTIKDKFISKKWPVELYNKKGRGEYIMIVKYYKK